MLRREIEVLDLSKTEGSNMLQALSDLSSIHSDPFRNLVWEKKYKAGEDENISDTLARLCVVGINDYKIMFEGKFLPGGRILHSLGVNGDYRATPMNCFVIPIEEDSIEGIFDCAKAMAKTYSYGGGVGVDISGLRPRGSKVRNVAKSSTGSVSFTKLFDVVTEVIGQQGRRGALLVCLHVAHPDILEFITCKQDKYSNLNMNISVKIPDQFMKAVEDDLDWELWFPFFVREVDRPPHSAKELDYLSECFDFPQYEHFVVKGKLYTKQVVKRVRAREIWDLISKTARDTAEPGVLFWDTMLRDHSLYRPRLLSTNPCGELPLPAWGCCNLGSINLIKFVDIETGELKEDELEEVVRFGIRFLDKVLQYSVRNEMFPLGEQTEAVNKLQKIGLGITGLADALILAKMKYGSPESLEFVDRIMSLIEKTAYDESIQIAKEREPVLIPPFIGHPAKARRRYPDLGWESGLAHTSLLSVAPTGSISQLLACSTGCEPLFATEYERMIRISGKEEIVRVKHWLLRDLEELGLNLNEYVVTTQEIDYKDRIAMQAVIQEHVDSSISSTVNLPSSTQPEDVRRLYQLAWEKGCKGVTVYVEGSRDAVIKAVSQKEDKINDIKPIVDRNELEIIEGKTIRIPTDPPCYLTLNFYRGRPIEVFLTIAKSGSDMKAMSEAIGRLISLYLQQGGDIRRVIKTLKEIRGEMTWMKDGWIVHSPPDAAAKGLLRLLGEQSSSKGLVCPQCGARTYIEVNGCGYCQSCGFSRCG